MILRFCLIAICLLTLLPAARAAEIATTSDIVKLSDVLPKGTYSGYGRGGQKCTITVDDHGRDGSIYSISIEPIQYRQGNGRAIFIAQPGSRLQLTEGGYVIEQPFQQEFLYNLHVTGILNVNVARFEPKGDVGSANCAVQLRP